MVTNSTQTTLTRSALIFAWGEPCVVYCNYSVIQSWVVVKLVLFHVLSLLKAHALEARSIIRQALDVLTPVVPVRMEDANATLVHWTKKIIVEEGYSVAQLIHML